eukprot:GHVN01025863.1.p1 GENE.GHVN01025863.1~~GHVN01025863.1.p1  ORF type:complete len:258 (+),score=30.33 GHVN01025863.1:133-906(+)
MHRLSKDGEISRLKQECEMWARRAEAARRKLDSNRVVKPNSTKRGTQDLPVTSAKTPTKRSSDFFRTNELPAPVGHVLSKIDLSLNETSHIKAKIDYHRRDLNNVRKHNERLEAEILEHRRDIDKLVQQEKAVTDRIMDVGTVTHRVQRAAKEETERFRETRKLLLVQLEQARKEEIDFSVRVEKSQQRNPTFHNPEVSETERWYREQVLKTFFQNAVLCKSIVMKKGRTKELETAFEVMKGCAGVDDPEETIHADL